MKLSTDAAVRSGFADLRGLLQRWMLLWVMWGSEVVIGMFCAPQVQAEGQLHLMLQ